MRCLFLVLGVVLLGSSISRAQENAEVEKWVQDAEDAVAKVDSYTAVFHRVELVKGKLLPERVVVLKFKRPLKVYMKWIRPSKGQESLYVDGENDNKIRAHGTGLTGFVTVNLDPKGGKAMQYCRHPITEAGLHNLVGKLASNMHRAAQSGELVTKDHGERTVYGRKTRELEGILPKDASKGYYCYRCIVDLDVETRMPVKTEIFDWENQLVECYGYEDLNLKPGLSDKDFDYKNPEYHF